MLFLMLDVFSYGIIYAVPFSPKNRLQKHETGIRYYDIRVWSRLLTLPLGGIGYTVFPNLKEQVVSQIPKDWQENETKFEDSYSEEQSAVLTLERQLSSPQVGDNQKILILAQINHKIEHLRQSLRSHLRTVQGADLRGFKLSYLEGNKAFLVNAKLQESDFRKAYLQEADLRGVQGARLANTTAVNLQQADLNHTQLQCADLKSADLRGADLRGTDLRMADLRNVNMRGPHLVIADLDGLDLGTPRLLGVLLENSDLRESDLRGALFIIGKLGNADLRNSDMRGTHLTFANLTYSKLSGAKMNGIYLTRADLSFADLTRANLNGAKNITKKQILEAKWREVPTGLPAEWKLTPKHNWTKDDEENWKSLYPNGY